MKRNNRWYVLSAVIGLSLIMVGTAHAIWTQVNEDGFSAARSNSSWAMAMFNDVLYVGTALPGRLYRTDGTRSDSIGTFRWIAVALPRSFPGVTDYEIETIAALKVL